MNNNIHGLHHITAIAGNPQRNYDFYAKTLGLRLVKKTVNFDDPQTYHFYFGNTEGTPGTILTFFPWPGTRHGKTGGGMATEIGFSVPEGSLEYWKQRFETLSVSHASVAESFGERFISFTDPDGLNLKLVESKQKDNRKPWSTADVIEDNAIRGFQSVTLTLKKASPTAGVLTGLLDYELVVQQENVYRYQSKNTDTAAIVDLIEIPDAPNGIVAGGTNHHVAFRVKDEKTLMAVRQKIVDAGLHITEKVDRKYFYSLYFREPGGVLFEIATDNPGFAIDENAATLGHSLKLPDQYEPYRKTIENSLPALAM